MISHWHSGERLPACVDNTDIGKPVLLLWRGQLPLVLWQRNRAFLVVVGFSGSLAVFWRLFSLTFRQSLWPASSEDRTLCSSVVVCSRPWKPSRIQLNQNFIEILIQDAPETYFHLYRNPSVSISKMQTTSEMGHRKFAAWWIEKLRNTFLLL